MRSPARQWIAVGAVAALLGAGTFALVRWIPPEEAAITGKRAPNYPIRPLNGTVPVGIRTAYRGHVTLINIWATWCHPCEKEMPSLQQLYLGFKDRGFRVAAASVDPGSDEPVRIFVNQRGLSFDILRDPDGNIQQVYQTVGVPESFLLDRNGIVVYIALGAEDWNSAANRQRVEQLLDRSD